MAFNQRQLAVQSSGPFSTHWSYRTTDTRRELEGLKYWTKGVSVLNIGDFIFVQHIGRGSAIYCVGPLGQVRQLCEWPLRGEAE